jgi:hypothetical protein
MEDVFEFQDKVALRPMPAAVVARTASLAMAIALALMSWLSVAMELSFDKIGDRTPV